MLLLSRSQSSLLLVQVKVGFTSRMTALGMFWQIVQEPELIDTCSTVIPVQGEDGSQSNSPGVVPEPEDWILSKTMLDILHAEKQETSVNSTAPCRSCRKYRLEEDLQVLLDRSVDC